MVCWKDSVSFRLPGIPLSSEVCRLAHLILVMPSTNAVSERSFSSMKRLKTYFRSTMHQDRLNHVMLLNMNHEKVDQLDIECHRR